MTGTTRTRPWLTWRRPGEAPDTSRSTRTQTSGSGREEQGLRPFGHHALARVTGAPKEGQKAFSFASLSETPTLFVCATPLSLGHMGTSIAAIMVRMLQHLMNTRFKAQQTSRRLFLVLDEFSKFRMGSPPDVGLYQHKPRGQLRKRDYPSRRTAGFSSAFESPS